MSTLKIAVIGAGIGGLTAALALQAHEIPVTVFEQADTLRELGAGVGIAPNGLRALGSIGAQEPVLARGSKQRTPHCGAGEANASQSAGGLPPTAPTARPSIT